MQGTLQRCLYFIFHTPADAVRSFLPPHLKPITYKNKAFYNFTISQVHQIRPLYFPKALGFSYWHIAYRLYVRFQAMNGEWVEGLYFIRSDCDKWWLSPLGNLTTDFNFHYAPMKFYEDSSNFYFRAFSSTASVNIHCNDTAPTDLVEHSIFDSQRCASEFLQFKPHDISIQKNGKANVVAITRNQTPWPIHPLTVKTQDWKFLHPKTSYFECCYEMRSIDYQWNSAKKLTKHPETQSL